MNEKNENNLEESSTSRFGIFHTVIDWILSVCSMITAYGGMLQEDKNIRSIIASLLFIVYSLAILPIEPMLNYWQKICKNKKFLRPILLVLFFFIICIVMPGDAQTDDENNISIANKEELITEENKQTAKNIETIPIKESNDNSKENSTETKETDKKNTPSKSTKIDSPQKTIENKESNDISTDIKNLLGKNGFNNFKEASEEINLDITKISNFEKTKDWASGKRYSFNYGGSYFLLYMLENDYVSGINCGLFHIYEDGYESRDINSCLVDISTLSSLQVETETIVKKQLNHPKTANFHWFSTGSFLCINNVYYISADVDAKNSFGVEDTISFSVEYQLIDGTYKLKYFELDGNKISGKHINPNDDRKTVESKIKNSASSANSIIITEGQQGEYGKLYSKDPNIYFYYLPEGTYTVKALNKGKAFISLPNDDENCDVYSFDKVGDVQTITIPKGYIVQLMINTSLEFIKQ